MQVLGFGIYLFVYFWLGREGCGGVGGWSIGWLWASERC